MTTIYIHMGCHRTASTSIQKFCNDNRPLLENNNIGYMPSKNNGRHTELNQCSLRRDVAIFSHPNALEGVSGLINRQRDSIFKFIETSQAQKFLFSDEGLDFIRTEAELDRLKGLFPSYCELIPVIVLREKNEWKKSWLTYLKNKNQDISDERFTISSSPYFLNEDSWYFDIDDLLSLLDENFDRVIKLNYDKNMVSKFLSQLNVEATEEYVLNKTSDAGKSKDFIFDILKSFIKRRK